MGHQVNFFATEADEFELFQRMAKRLDMVVISHRSMSPEPHVVRCVDGHVTATGYHLALVRPVDLPRVLPSPTKYKEGEHAVNAGTAPVIEVTRSVTCRDRCHRGRLWFSATAWVDGRNVAKDPEFVAWARKVLAATKRAWEFHAPFFHWSEGALTLRRELGDAWVKYN